MRQTACGGGLLNLTPLISKDDHLIVEAIFAQRAELVFAGLAPLPIQSYLFYYLAVIRVLIAGPLPTTTTTTILCRRQILRW
jgi:hypothetical protein